MKGYSLGRLEDNVLNMPAPSFAPQFFSSTRAATSAVTVRKSVILISRLLRAFIRCKAERSPTFSNPEPPVYPPTNAYFTPSLPPLNSIVPFR